ncbi:hypothetical protein DMENIID0001_037950 [Sergentomyia squamirostris]
MTLHCCHYFFEWDPPNCFDSKASNPNASTAKVSTAKIREGQSFDGKSFEMDNASTGSSKGVVPALNTVIGLGLVFQNCLVAVPPRDIKTRLCPSPRKIYVAHPRLREIL